MVHKLSDKGVHKIIKHGFGKLNAGGKKGKKSKSLLPKGW